MQGLAPPQACVTAVHFTQAFILPQFGDPPLLVYLKGTILRAVILCNLWFHYLRVTNVVDSCYHIHHIYLTGTMLCYNCTLFITFFNFFIY